MIHPLLFLPLPLYLFLMLTLASLVSSGWTWFFSSSPKPQPVMRAWSLSLGSLSITAGVQYAPAYSQKGYYS